MATTTLSLAKTTRPTLTNVLARERLFSALDDMPGVVATWVAGPPGAGKTTFVASYLEARGLATLWYQLDTVDADAASFFHYLRQTAIKHSRDAATALPEVPANATDWHSFGRRLFRALFSRYAGRICVVFDNYEALPITSELHAILAAAIDEVPPASRMFFCSRIAPPANYARARSAGRIASMGGEDLRLTDAECESLARLRGADANKELVAHIQQAAAGWLTGTILMIEYARRTPNLDDRRVWDADGVLFDYVAAEVFAQFEDSVRAFMLAVCWPRRLSMRLAETLSGHAQARQILGNLARNNYFVTERDDTQQREYVLHPLLRDFLRSRAVEQLTETRVRDQQCRCATLLIEDGQIEEGVELLAANLAWDRLAPVITAHAPVLVSQGRTELLVRWIEEFPQDRLHADAWLLYWYATARRMLSPREARHHFDLAQRAFAAQDDAGLGGRALACCGCLETVAAERDEFTALDPWIAVTETLAGRADLVMVPHAFRVARAMVLALALRNPAYPGYGRWLDALVRALRDTRDQHDRMSGSLCLILGYLMAGDLAHAREQLALSARRDGTDIAPVLQVHQALLTALATLLGGDVVAARTTVDDGVRLAAEHGLDDVLPMLYAAAAAIALTIRDLDAARRSLDLLAASAVRGQRLVRFLDRYLASWLALQEDRLIDAHHAQRAALGAALELGMPVLEVLSRTALAQLLFLCRDDPGGTAQLRRVHGIARDLNNPLLEFMTLLTYADIALREGRSASGANALRYALGLGRQHACYHIPWWHPRQLADVCVAALRLDIEPEYVRDLVVRGSLRPSRTPLDLPNWPWPLRVTTFGGLQLHGATAVDNTVAKSAGRPLQVLKVLIALGARDVRFADVARELWPHVDTEYAHKSLTINLHRLRKLLASDDAVRLDEGRLSINQDLVWIDALALGSLQEAITARLRSGGAQSAVALGDLADRLVSIYGGPFLGADADYACLADARERLRGVLCTSVLALVEALDQRGANDHARRICEQISAIDPDCKAIRGAAAGG